MLSLLTDAVAYPSTYPFLCKSPASFAFRFLIFSTQLSFLMLVRQRFHENKIDLNEHEVKAHVFAQDLLQALRFVAQSLKVLAAFGWTYQAFEHSLELLGNSRLSPYKGF